MPLYKWSPTAAANATADPSINWSEGQAPSSVNNSARAMMARLAEYRDDTSGLLVAGGTSTAYTLASNQVFDSLAHMHTATLCFIPTLLNGDNSTLNVNSLGAFPLVSGGTPTPLPAGTLIPGVPYTVMFTTFDNTFRLKGLVGNPYNIPLGGGMDYWLPTVPNSSFAFPIGQAISRTTYAALFAGMGTTYGAGDGSTTFNLPDKTGRVSAMKEAGASRLTSTYFGGNSTLLGAVGGAESQTLTLAQTPTGITSTGTVVSPSSNYLTSPVTGYGITSFSAGTGGAEIWQAFSSGASVVVASNITSTGSMTSGNTGGGAHANVQPTIVCNYIMRII